MTDCVFIEGLAVMATIGVLDWERQIKQKLIFDIEMTCDTQAAANSDNVEHALDYAAVSQRVIEVSEASDYQLIESLAEQISQMILSEFSTFAVTLKITKPAAVRDTRSVGVVIRRSQNDSTGDSDKSSVDATESCSSNG